MTGLPTGRTGCKSELATIKECMDRITFTGRCFCTAVDLVASQDLAALLKKSFRFLIRAADDDYSASVVFV